MKATRSRDLLIAFGVVAFGVGVIAWSNYERLPRFALSAPVSLLLISVFEAYTALAIRGRLDGRPGTKPIMPILVARYAALAKASSLSATLAAGAWSGVVAFAALHRDQFRYADRDIVLGGAGVVAAVLLVVAALYLERACRVRHPPENPDGVPDSRDRL